MKSCVIFAGGIIADTDALDVGKIKNADCIICADRGCVYAEKLGIKPDLIVGDFDSYDGAFPENTEIYRSVPEKDDTDTLLAVKKAISAGCDEITLYGGLGGRFDHAFANVQTIIYAHKRGCKMTIADRDNELTAVGAGEYRLKNRCGFYISLFSLTERAMIDEWSGVKYPLENYEMSQEFPIGVSNEITADEAFLRISSGIVLIVRSVFT